jgi:hypothetical protein
MNYKYFYKDESRKDWSVLKEKASSATNDDLKLGAILRIADATELMAKNFIALQKENEYLRQRNMTLAADYETEKKRSAKYKGLYNKEKKNKNQNS